MDQDESRNIYKGSTSKTFRRKQSVGLNENSITDPTNEFIDISIDEFNPSHMPNVDRSIETLSQIQLYNQKLPKRRKIKDKLDEIPTANISTTYLQKRDKKKGTLSLITNYK